MKRKILVLDVHTNGYEAALKFIRKQGWQRRDCEIISCGSHSNLLRKLSEGPAFAVVPVHNSTRGALVKIQKEIDWYRKAGCEFDVVDTLPMKIRHALMTTLDVSSLLEVQRIYSKEEAIEQCGKYLKQNGFNRKQYSYTDSTGAAARFVANKKGKVKFAAIAPRCAARAYDLWIINDNIQDTRNNTTTFHLLQNRVYVRPVTVGIIGMNGRFGSCLKAFYENLGCAVIGSDKEVPTEFSNADVVKKADVVIVAVRVRSTAKVIKSIARYTRENQLIMDVTSVKRPAVEAMRQCKAQIVGTHPMHAPEYSFRGQTLVVCMERLTMPHWRTWVVNVFTRMGVIIKKSTAMEHDNYMATVQISPQSSNFINAWLITELGVPVGESLTFTSPYYRIMFSMMGRLLTQSPELYFGIMMKNEATLTMLRKRQKLTDRLIRIIERKDHRAFARIHDKIKGHFGTSVTRDANELFIRLIAVTKTLYEKNSVILEFNREQNEPGLLLKILQVFSKRNVNLAEIHSVDLNGWQMQFAISFRVQDFKEGVEDALNEILSWKTPKIGVIRSVKNIPSVVQKLFSNSLSA